MIKIIKKIRKFFKRCRYYIKQLFSFNNNDNKNVELITPKKKSSAANRDYFARCFGYIDYNDFRKKYCREPLKELQLEKPLFLVGKLALDRDNDDKRYYTFLNIKPLCPGFEVREICDHLNIAKSIVHRWYRRPIVEKDNNIYFAFECRVNQYESMITAKRPDFLIKRYGIDVVNEIVNVPPFFCARGQTIVNNIPRTAYVNFTEPKINRYIGRGIGIKDKKGRRLFQYCDLEY